MSARPRLLRAVAVLASSVLFLLMVVLSWGTAGPAGAHPYLVQTLPGPGAILRNPPEAIEVAFTEPVVLEGSSLRLEDAEGTEFRLGPLRQPGGGPGIAAEIEGILEAGVYEVHWVVLGDDGHTSSGDFRFGVAKPGGDPPPGAEDLVATGGPSDQTAAADGVVRIGMRWAGLLGASLLLGGAVLVSRLRGRLDPDAEAAMAARWGVASRAGWILALVGAGAAALAAAAAGAGPTRLDVALASDTGRLAVARLVVLIAAAIPAVLLRQGTTRDNLLGLAGAVFLGTEAAGGHLTALESGQLPAGLAQAAHLAAGAIWVGGVLILAFALRGVPKGLRPAAWRSSAAIFSPLAAAAAAVVVVTGMAAAVREVQYRYFLFFSSYGRILLVKLALVAGMLVLGGLARASLRKRRRRAPAGTTRVADPRSPAGAGLPPAGAGPGRRLPSEAFVGAAILVLAATLVGVAQGRGQPLPAQRESVLAGPAFSNVVVGGRLVRLVLAPAAPGPNRLALVAAPTIERQPAEPAAGTEGEEGSEGEEEAPALPTGDLDVSLTCACTPDEVEVTLPEGESGGTWTGDVDLPAEGVWQVSVALRGQAAVAPVALRVADEGAPGAPPVFVAAPADLSGPGARRCRSYQLGMLLAVGFLNADGGVGGRKVVLDSIDDGGDPERARAEAAKKLDAGVHLSAPCGRGAAAAAEVLGAEVPVILGDAQTPLVAGERIFRLTGDPFAEGWAVGRTTLRGAFLGRPDVPRRMSVVIDEGETGEGSGIEGDDRALAGLEAALDLPPSDAVAAIEGDAAPSGVDVEVEVFRRRPGEDLLPLVRDAIDPRRFASAFLRSDPEDLAAALDGLTNEELAGPAAVFVGTRQFDETFVRGSRLGRRGDIIHLGEVAPDSAESLIYSRIVNSLYPGEQPAIDGLRGYMAGKAITEVLRDGASAGGLTARLTPLGPFSDGVASGWSPGAPAAGSWRFFLYKGSFIPSGLIYGEEPNPGRFFPEGGAWSRVNTRNIGLCGPQGEFAGPAPECVPLPEDGEQD